MLSLKHARSPSSLSQLRLFIYYKITIRKVGENNLEKMSMKKNKIIMIMIMIMIMITIMIMIMIMIMITKIIIIIITINSKII